MKLYDIVRASGIWNRSEENATAASDSLMSDRTVGRTADFGLTESGSLYAKSAYSVVGINVHQIPAIRDAIKQYVDAIISKIEEIDPNADANTAYRSEEVQKAVQRYMSKVKEYATNLTSSLLAFSDKLLDVQHAYEKNMGRIAREVDSNSSTFRVGQRYQEK